MIYFTSDHHFSHKNVIQLCNRPFKSVEEMDEGMIRRWNEIVKPNDTVYYLGDFSLSIKPVEKYVSRLNGIKILVPGNHDLCHPCHGNKSKKMIEKYLSAGFKNIHNGIWYECEDVDLNLEHMPYRDDSDQRYSEYRPYDNGNWLLHGHIHNRWKVKDKMINVGVDVWDFYPVSLEQILKIIESKDNGSI